MGLSKVKRTSHKKVIVGYMTDAEAKYKRRKRLLKRFLEDHPEAEWARNELKYMTIDDFSDNPRTLLQDQAYKGVCDDAISAEIQYNGSTLRR